ncbi:MAG: topoisomerase C-terminal repeat-containing protein, partial [Dokdonella sp.]
LVRERAELLANRIITDFGNGTQVLNGRYGPYITDGNKNARMPKDRDPKTLTATECAELIAAAPDRPKRGSFGKKKTAAKKAASSDKADAPKKKAPAKKAAKKKSAKKKAPAKKAAAKKAAKKAAVNAA